MYPSFIRHWDTRYTTRALGINLAIFKALSTISIDEQQDWEKVEVRNYQQALKIGVETIQICYPLTERLIRNLHQLLMENARGATSAAGEYRKIQNFIGPTNELKDASYVPPEPQLMGQPIYDKP